ncbi:hypothetical protein KAU34_02020 [candidate division WOR-3 bacterium]|nr:hypothetical protein [candidate division WOR-3 bacterium]
MKKENNVDEILKKMKQAIGVFTNKYRKILKEMKQAIENSDIKRYTEKFGEILEVKRTFDQDIHENWQKVKQKGEPLNKKTIEVSQKVIHTLETFANKLNNVFEKGKRESTRSN